MSANSEISWTDHTFNPWWGCSKVSPGCKNCYADRFAHRLGKDLWGPGVPRLRQSANVWSQPLKWNSAAQEAGRRDRVFVASMADFFDAEVPRAWRTDLWALIRSCASLDWQILSKRPENIASMLPPDWGYGWHHVWLGVSTEDQIRADILVPILRAIPAGVRFLSIEPLIGPVKVKLNGIHWVIAGGESGPGYRPMHPQWIRSVRDQCLKARVPFHFKQWGTQKKKAAGRTLDGKVWDEFPAPVLPWEPPTESESLYINPRIRDFKSR